MTNEPIKPNPDDTAQADVANDDSQMLHDGPDGLDQTTMHKSREISPEMAQAFDEMIDRDQP